MKNIAVINFIFIFVISLSLSSFAQKNEKAIIYLNRLKKSTESYTDYSIWVNDKEIGVFEGTNPVFTQNYFGKWIVFTTEAKNKSVFEIRKLNESVAKLVVNIKANDKYFITFDSGVTNDENPLKLIEKQEGFEALYASNNELIRILDESIRKEVFQDKKTGYLDYVKVENKEDSVTEESNNLSKDTYAFIISSKPDKAFEKLQNALSNNEKVNKLIKEEEFDYYKSYSFEPNKDNTIMGELKKAMNEFSDNDNILIYYFDSEKRIYIAVNHLSTDKKS